MGSQSKVLTFNVINATILNFMNSLINQILIDVEFIGVDLSGTRVCERVNDFS